MLGRNFVGDTQIMRHGPFFAAGALESWRRVILNFGVAPGAEIDGNSAPDFCTT